jgi:beta-lactam-binding protein with PASTA domain
MLKNLFPFLRSKTFRYSLMGALALFVILFLFLQQWLGGFTHHGESITVPDIRGMKLDRMESFLHENSLEFEVVDSLFELEKKPGTVLDQDPAPKSKVKEGRTIYITINASQPPKVKVPNLIDVSFRQAEAMLESYGLKVGQLIYKPDLAKNAVLEQRYRGAIITPGREINKGSAIDLVLGDGMGNTEVPVPDLTGLTSAEATFALKGSSLNVGTLHYDPGVKDTLKATVYRQVPTPGENATLSQGEAVDMYLR